MSHFYLIALVPKNGVTPHDPTKKSQWTEEGERYVRGFLKKQMERYNENREVPEYERECWCVNMSANSDARVKADEVLSIKEAQEIMAERRAKELPEVHEQIKKDGHCFGLSADQEYADSQLWEDVLKPRTEAQQVFVEAHPLYGKPDPTCEDCNGTGRNTSTYNPESKWDWYRPGGRWVRAIQKKDWRQPPGTDHYDNTCEALHLNTVTVDQMLEQWEPTDAPLALLTPDGEWHERGAMGMFGMFKCAPHSPGQWREAVKKMLETHNDCIAVGIDCHI